MGKHFTRRNRLVIRTCADSAVQIWRAYSQEDEAELVKDENASLDSTLKIGLNL